MERCGGGARQAGGGRRLAEQARGAWRAARRRPGAGGAVDERCEGALQWSGEAAGFPATRAAAEPQRGRAAAESGPGAARFGSVRPVAGRIWAPGGRRSGDDGGDTWWLLIRGWAAARTCPMAGNFARWREVEGARVCTAKFQGKAHIYR